jgi:hypothetical protein
MNKLFIYIATLLAIFSSAKAQCSECELVVNFVEQWVENNATESQIIQYLQTVCGLFPAYQDTCDAIAEQGASQVISWIEANETPASICSQLGLCTSQATKKIGTFKIPNISSMKNVKLPIPAKAQRPHLNDVECDGCIEIVGIIENWLDQSNNQEEVISAVEVVCTYMPGWESTCDAIITTGVPTVVQWIDTYENSSTVCEQLGLCGSKAIAAPIKKVTDDCGDCSSIVAMIENYLLSNYSESVIVQYVEIACTVVPQWTSLCDSYISAGVPQIIQWIEENETAQDICTEIGFCSTKIISKLPMVKIN